MRDFVTHAFKLGLGAMDLTREQAEQLLDTLQKEYGAEIKDGRQMIDEMVERAEAHRKRIAKDVDLAVQDAIKVQKLVPKEDLKELAANVKQLARQLEKVTRQLVKTQTHAKAVEKAAKRPARVPKKAKKSVKRKRK